MDNNMTRVDIRTVASIIGARRSSRRGIVVSVRVGVRHFALEFDRQIINITLRLDYCALLAGNCT